MPESEPKPRALEAITPGSPLGWKAVLRNGRQVVVHEIPATPSAAAAAVPRLQRLAEHPHPSLSPILAWGTEEGGVWVAVEPNEGTPLAAVLSRGRFTPHAAAALGLSVLSGVAALHEAGVAMGGFDASAVRLTGNGETRIAGHPVAAVRGAPSQGDLRADVRSCGMAICAAFGVDPAGAPAPQELPPGLVVAMRSMASGAMGPAVDRAQGSLREMAGPLLAPDRQTAAQSEIALRAGGRVMPSITPFIPGAEERPAAPAPAPAPPPPAPVEEAPPSRSVSYDAPPRPVDTYAPAARPVETYPPASAYQTSASPPPQAPVEPPPAEAPAPPPMAPAATNPPAPVQDVPSWEQAAPAPRTPPTWEQAEPAPQAPQPPESAQVASQAPPPVAETPPAPASPFASAPPPAEVAAAPVEPAQPSYEPPPIPAEPAGPIAPAAAAAAAAASSRGTGEWSPVETGSWTPGPSRSHISSSEWTGEATPAPQPVPEEFKQPTRAASGSEAAVGGVPRAAAPSPRAPSRRPSLALPSERPAWLIPAAIGVVVLLILGSAGIYLAGHRGATTTTARNSPHPTASAKASPSPTNVLQEVPVYAPTSAAPIKQVQFCSPSTPCVAPGIPNATDTNCQLGARCTVDVGIFYSPTYGGQVSYVLKFFDRCTGTSTDLPGRSATAGNSQFPKFSVSEVSTNVTLPTGSKAAALVAVTQTPSVVASAPLLLGASSC